jgi:hypothetical protein
MSGKLNTNRTFGVHRPGIGNAASYQVAGYPFITGTVAGDNGTDGVTADLVSKAGSTYRIQFPTVAKSVTVIGSGTVNLTPSLRVHFNPTSSAATAGTHGVSDGSNNVFNQHHYIALDSDEDSVTFNVKCSEIYVTTMLAGSGFQLFAELTHIPVREMYALTGSGLTFASASLKHWTTV